MEKILDFNYQYGFDITKLINYGYLDYLIISIKDNILFLKFINIYIDYVRKLFYFYNNDVILLIVSASLN